MTDTMDPTASIHGAMPLCATLGITAGESKTNFLGAVRSGTVTATARPLHVGSSTIVIETELVNADRLVGKVTQTQTVLRPRTG